MLTGVAAGTRVAALFGRPCEPDAVQLIAVLANGLTGTLSVAATIVSDAYPALTPECPQAHWFEREIAEQGGYDQKDTRGSNRSAFIAPIALGMSSGLPLMTKHRYQV